MHRFSFQTTCLLIGASLSFVAAAGIVLGYWGDESA